uniref:peptidylprolyl isomerase n=1 Tax=Chlamydomonas euryale TaxID=1486919 RepID=A0A7R9YVU0_9CHLO
MACAKPGEPMQQVQAHSADSPETAPPVGGCVGRRRSMLLAAAAAALPMAAAVAPANAGFKKEMKKKRLTEEDYTPSEEVGLPIYETEEGSGPDIKLGDRVLVHFDVMYRGLDVVSSRASRLLGANRTISEPFEFIVGSPVAEVSKKQMSDSAGGLFSGQGGPRPPPALSTAVLGMRRGGRRSVLVTDPARGYGDKGVGEMPGNTTFELKVEVLRVGA